jgi:ribosomal protein S27E
LPNPIFNWIIAHTVAETLMRRCPKCRRKQAVPEAKAHDAVPCEKCGAPVPPPKKK